MLLRNFNRMPSLRTTAQDRRARNPSRPRAIGFAVSAQDPPHANILSLPPPKIVAAPVEARRVSMECLPFPRLAVEGVSIKEHHLRREYFLRRPQDGQCTVVRLLRGHSISHILFLAQPDFCSQRNRAAGSWKEAAPGPLKISCNPHSDGPQSPADPANNCKKSNSTKPTSISKTERKRPSHYKRLGSVRADGPRKLAMRPKRNVVAEYAPVPRHLESTWRVAGTSRAPAREILEQGQSSIADIFSMSNGATIRRSRRKSYRRRRQRRQSSRGRVRLATEIIHATQAPRKFTLGSHRTRATIRRKPESERPMGCRPRRRRTRTHSLFDLPIPFEGATRAQNRRMSD